MIFINRIKGKGLRWKKDLSDKKEKESKVFMKKEEKLEYTLKELKQMVQKLEFGEVLRVALYEEDEE